MCYGTNLSTMMYPIMNNYSSYGSYGYGCGCGGNNFGSWIGNMLAYGACNMAMQFGSTFISALGQGIMGSIFSATTPGAAVSAGAAGAGNKVAGGAASAQTIETIESDIETLTSGTDGLITKNATTGKYEYDNVKVEQSLIDARTAAQTAYDAANSKLADNAFSKATAKLTATESDLERAKASYKNATAEGKTAAEAALQEAQIAYDKAKDKFDELKAVKDSLTQLKADLDAANKAITDRQVELTQLVETLNTKVDQIANIKKARKTAQDQAVLNKGDKTIGERSVFKNNYEYVMNNDGTITGLKATDRNKKFTNRDLLCLINQYKKSSANSEERVAISNYLKNVGKSDAKGVANSTKEAYKLITGEDWPENA